MSIVPNNRPQTPRDGVLSFLSEIPQPAFPFLVGRRGFYGDSMGEPGANDVNVYDDALFLVERASVVAFNANCDPGRHAKGMANLKPGLWYYRPGIHHISDPDVSTHYEALVQAGPVTIMRDEEGEETGYFGINIHCGGNTVTSSSGCQTIPPAQWGEKHGPAKPGDFMYCIHAALAREGRDEKGRDTLTYILTTRYA